jgi:hypothetical protein
MRYIHGIYPDMAIEIWGKQRFQLPFKRVSLAAGFSEFSEVSAAGSRDGSSLAKFIMICQVVIIHKWDK